MKHVIKKVLSLTLLLSTAIAFGSDCDSKTTSCYPNRSQSRYKMRQVAGSVGHTHDSDTQSNESDDGYWGTLSITPGYHQTFRAKEIAHCLFNGDLTSNCDCDGRIIRVQGSNVTGESRDAKAWLADYFYLPRDFDSTLVFKPTIKNFIMDFDLYVGLDKWIEGAYLRIHGPLVHTRWDLNMNETNNSQGTEANGSYPIGYFTPLNLPITNLNTSFQQYANGTSPGTIEQTDVAAVDHTIVFQPLKCAKMSDCSRNKTGFADLRIELGYHWWTGDDYHFSVGAELAAPTGNKCCPNWLFDAKVGNGKHWELGAVFTGHYNLWQSDDAQKTWSAHLDATISYMFDTTMERTFDLQGKPNSKYMLATKFGPNTQQVAHDNDGNETLAIRQFVEEYAPVANITTVRVDVGSNLHADVVTWLNCSTENYSFDIGYNLYYRSCEKIVCNPNCGPCDPSKPSLADESQSRAWALKGDARMYGYMTAPNAPLLNDQAIPLSVTQTFDATIHGGNEKHPGTLKTTMNDAMHRNHKADNVVANPGSIGTDVFAHAVAGPSDTDLSLVPTNNTRLSTSIQPALLSLNDIDFSGTKNLSHSFFMHINRNLEDRGKWRPYIGIGAMVEIGSTSDGCCQDLCTGCTRCTASYWGVWLKGGASFD